MTTTLSEPAAPDIQDDEFFFRHDGRDLHEVMLDVTTQEPEESFCFFNEHTLRERFRLFSTTFLPQYPNKDIAYAMKANPRERILEILLEEGMRIVDCASIFEAEKIRKVATRLGVTVDTMLNHPVKRNKDIERAFEIGVNKLTVQTREEVEKILSSRTFPVDKTTEIMVRLETLNDQAEIDLSEKFGAELNEVRSILSFIKECPPYIQSSLSVNIGSQNPDPYTFVQVAKIIRDLVRKYGDLATINFGGGMPVSYHANETYDINEYLKTINTGIEQFLLPEISDRTNIVIEPGRSLIAKAIDLLIPVLYAGMRRGRQVAYFYDGVFTSFSDAVVHGWKYNFRAFQPNGAELQTEKEPYILYGRTCDSGDVMPQALLPSGLRTGDFIWMRNAGAYMDCQGTTFNGFPLPSYVSYNMKPTAD